MQLLGLPSQARQQECFILKYRKFPEMPHQLTNSPAARGPDPHRTPGCKGALCTSGALHTPVRPKAGGVSHQGGFWGAGSTAESGSAVPLSCVLHPGCSFLSRLLAAFHRQPRNDSHTEAFLGKDKKMEISFFFSLPS